MLNSVQATCIRQCDNIIPAFKNTFSVYLKIVALFNIDYSNLEMRVMGLVTKEESMTNAFLSGHDIHKDNVPVGIIKSGLYLLSPAISISSDCFNSAFGGLSYD